MVHKGSKLNRENFFSRVSCVKAIRHRLEDFNLTYYPTSIEKWSLWKGIYHAVNEGNFDGLDVYNPRRTFVLILPRKAYDLFRRVDLGVIQNQIVSYISFLWEMDLSMRHVMTEQIYSPVLDRAKNLAGYLFPDGINQNIEIEELKSIFVEAVKKETGISPFEFILIPGESNNHVKSEWGIGHDFHLSYAICYFNDLDWTLIIDKGEKDDLWRSESLSEPWEMWKHDFQLGDGAPCGEVKIFEEIPASGIVYLINQCGTGYYKIGWSTAQDPEKRLSSLQTGNPGELSVVGFFNVSSIKAEKMLHEIFSPKRTSGEWFNLSEEDVTMILDSQWRIRNFII
jgi:hypothetical protein